ncbi:MAG: hydroxymethylglutaryl-CoA lyase [Ginsengibacter sp.]
MITDKTVSLIECPRDAMQGWPTLISTQDKIRYINQLLKVGFHTIDFGSFVSPKAIPQMADTKEVLGQLDLSVSATKLLAIVANYRGAFEAVTHENITYLGYPFSISPTFQKLNTNSTIVEAFDVVKQIQELCFKHDKTLVVYLSMAFGNPYNDLYDANIVIEWLNKTKNLGVKIMSVADTVGLAKVEDVEHLLKLALQHSNGIELGVHLHSSPLDQHLKIDAAFNAGCRRFDGALKGIGGCPMANNPLVGNIDSIFMVDHFKTLAALNNYNFEALQSALVIADEIFN